MALPLRRRSHGASNVVTTANRAALRDRRIHTDLDVIVLCRCAQNPWVSREVALRQSGHDASTARTSDVQTNLVADRKGLPDPGILNKSPFTSCWLYDDIWSKSANLKPPSREEFAQVIERRSR